MKIRHHELFVNFYYPLYKFVKNVKICKICILDRWCREMWDKLWSVKGVGLNQFVVVSTNQLHGSTRLHHCAKMAEQIKILFGVNTQTPQSSTNIGNNSLHLTAFDAA